MGRRSKIVATGSKGAAIHRSGGSASNDRERIATGLDPFDLANALQNTCLVSAASTSPCHH